MNNAIAQAQTFATHASTSLNFSSITNDFLAVIILAGALFIFARYIGRGPFVALIVSAYAGLALYAIFPFMSYLPSAPARTALISDVVLYIALSAITYTILRRVVVSDFISLGTVSLGILSLLGTGFLFALAYHIFPVRAVHSFTPAIDALFVAKTYFFWWIVAPLIGLLALT